MKTLPPCAVVTTSSTDASDVSRFGFARPMGRNLSLGLGTSEVTPVELVSAYSAFANGGKRLPPLFITRIEDSTGKLIEEFTSKPSEITSPQTAYLLTSMLEGVVQSGTGTAAKELGRPVAGKTGTTNDQHDASFIGYTPDLFAGIWVGYDDHRPLGRDATGGRVAAPIWVDFMKDAIRDKPATAFAMPKGIRGLESLALGMGKMGLLLMVMGIMLFMGFILEEISTMVVMVPIFWPSVLQLGIDPLHFGVVICTAAAIGYSTPPIALNLYTPASVANVPSTLVFRKVIPFLIGITILNVIVVFIPQLSTFSSPDVL